MIPRHRVSRAAIELIARFEGYRRKAAQLPDGGWTIGYGHTLTARAGAEVSREDAEALLLYDLIAVAHAINEWTYAPLSQNQFDALASFVFNIGAANFRRSAVLRRLNEGAPIQAACAMELWRKAEFAGERIVVDALVRRRATEKALFLTPEAGWPAAPTPVLRPLLDREAEALVPAETPAPLTARLEGETAEVLRGEEPLPPPLPPEGEDEASPVQAAAEAVSARLQTLFAETDTAGSAAAPEAGAAAGESAPETSGLAADPPFELQPPAETEASPSDWPPHAETEPEGPESGDLFAANDAAAPAEPSTEEPEPSTRILIDDTSPFEFTAPIVQPLPAQPGGGMFSLAALAVLGLAFFAGGLFWALDARPGVASGPLTPLAVGWLAGLTGVALFSLAVFLMLRRLARGPGDEDRP
jgi:lysozyme